MRWLAIFSTITLSGALLLRIQDKSANILRVTFLDVGQGDAAVVRFPQGTVWLIDAGGGWKRWDRGRDIHQELTRWGIRRVDRAWLSHPDMDHGLGFRGLLQSIAIGELRYSAVFTPLRQPLLADLVDRAIRRGTRVIAQQAAFDTVVEGVDTRSFASPASGNTNDSPLVVRLSYAGCRFLFAGDAESKTERRLAKSTWLPVDVLKVNHHGSRTSSSPEFVHAAAAQWALASAGARNRYGHPAPAVVRRLKEEGTRWLQTDVHGYAEFTVQPSGEIRCQSAAGPCGSSVCPSGTGDLGFAQLQ